MWKRELASHENEYLAEEIPKQNVEVAIWVLLIAYRKKKCERRDINGRRNCSVKRKLNLRCGKFLPCPYHTKNEKVHLENTKSVAGQ